MVGSIFHVDFLKKMVGFNERATECRRQDKHQSEPFLLKSNHNCAQVEMRDSFSAMNH